jgi:hypothetical protein
MLLTESKNFRLLCGAIVLIGAVLVAYSQTLALTWDEGFHLTAAQLINAGKRPYLDFLFAQTPLNAWWNAFWMRIFGQGWRLPHALAAVETTGAVMLMSDYVFHRFPAREWRFQAALVTAFLIGLNIVVVEYGTLAQAYGMCLLLTVAAFRFAVGIPNRRSLLLPALAGAAAGAAAASSLLTVTVAPVLLIWILWRNQAGNRWAKVSVFVAGIIVPFLPMLWLFVQSPHNVFFDVVNFHLFYRQVQWEGWQIHDLDVFTAWLDCSHAFILGALAVAGIFYIRRSDWTSEIRAEFYLCGWLALSTGAYLMTAHPTFPRYFLLLTPFVAVLAAAGLYGMIRQTGITVSARWPVALVVILMAVGLVRWIHEDSDDSWAQFEPIAQKVDEVTPRGAPLMADEHVYFLTNRLPPEGMNWNGGHKIDMPMDQARPLHVMPRAELVRQVKAGTFATVETCGEGEPDALGLAQLYKQKAEINDCFVFWDKKK